MGQFYHVSTDNQTPYHVYGGLQDNNSWMAPSSAPGGVTAVDWRWINGGDGFWVQPSLLNSKIIFSESQGGEITKVDLSTGLSYGVRPKKLEGDEEHRWNWNTPIVVGASTRKKCSRQSLCIIYILQHNMYSNQMMTEKIGKEYLQI